MTLPAKAKAIKPAEEARDVTHEVISSYFIGPRAENLPQFRENITTILDELQLARKNYFEQDVENNFTFIPPSIQSSPSFLASAARTKAAVQQTARLLGQHSIPFWSPRYQAHMCTDLSMPALLGYFMTMLYNPNNVAIEASPLSTVAEIEVGEQLCELFGFEEQGKAWGHVTCDGTVANIEALWVARNLKYYPLSVRKAMDDDDGPLRFISDEFRVRTCEGRLRLLKEMTLWEMMNLRVKTVLDIPGVLHEQFGITPEWLEEVMAGYNVQTVGKEALNRHFGVVEGMDGQFFVPSTKHYSWPKAAALVGLGSDNAVSVGVDDDARVDLDKLEKLLEERLGRQQPVYSVVAVIGSTEEGAVDPLERILAMRQRFQARGMSFMVHADAAWGGYFATMLPREGQNDVEGDGGDDGLVPDLSLRVETQQSLFALRYCDSITVDPHKAGYIPYPAGALTYRDGRIKSLVTWTSPYLSRGAVTSIGIYGVEGSKPGASAVSTWLSNQCIGLDHKGYGALLAEACFTSSRLSALWAALSTPRDSFICTPFNALPSEASFDPKEVEREKQRIRDEILSKSNTEIIAQDSVTTNQADKTITLLRALGSDLNINAFALNWRYPDGCLNTDVEEANYLMERVVSRLSVDHPDDNPSSIPLYLTSTEFEYKDYGDCATNFKRRLGLDTSTPHEKLMVLRNVVMSPLATMDGDHGRFINMLGETFKEVVEKEVKVCQARNDDSPDYHSFWIRGRGTSKTVYLSYRPMFHLAKHRCQIILEAEFATEEGRCAYRLLEGNTGDDEIILKTSDKIDLSSLLSTGASKTTLLGNLTTSSNGTILPRTPLTILSILKNRPLNTSSHDDTYPSGFCPFYLYGLPSSSSPPSSPSGGGGGGGGGGGTSQQLYIDHILTKSPNIFLSAPVDLTLDNGQPVTFSSAVSKGAILTVEGVHEAALQPFPVDEPLPANFFFKPGREFRVGIWGDSRAAGASARGLVSEIRKTEPLARGKIVLKEDGGIVVDVSRINRDPWKETEAEKVSLWRERFGKIGKEIDKEVSGGSGVVNGTGKGGDANGHVCPNCGE
ncbi:pyridoxal phosphate-dependent transferase [Triangularia setosa]|uniref:Pyridoxal phosphate-dependent transferase n=1 Tax=Triangularia setosa TaxID=2587417 RepID=A0AAN7A432_9PEZI|nr:pyridoxal phosphate-dependent transferase [Podospora setosa]